MGKQSSRVDRQVGVGYDSRLSSNFDDATICNSVRDASHMRDKGGKRNQMIAFKLPDPSSLFFCPVQVV